MPGLRYAAEDSSTNVGPHSSDGVPAAPVKKSTIHEPDAAQDVQPAHSTDTKRLGITDHSPILIEQVYTQRKGRGMIATEDIKRGTRIISEEPVLALALKDSSDETLLGKLMHLSPSQHDQLTELRPVKGEISPELHAKIATELEKSHQYSGRYLAAKVRDLVKMHAAFYTNAVEMGRNAFFGVGVFPTYSYLNHSCTPNVQQSYNATLGRETVHAIRDIQKGEEVTTSYVPLQRPKELRNEDIRDKWGFECECDACKDGASSEARRQRLFEIDQGFAFLEKSTDRRTFEDVLMRGLIPKSEGEALRWAEESVGLLKDEGLVGMDMAKAYRTCSKYSLREGQMEKGLGYARKELEVQVTCLGQDTAYLHPEDDANASIKQIETMSEADKVRMRMNEKRVLKEQKRENKKAAKKAAKR